MVSGSHMYVECVAMPDRFLHLVYCICTIWTEFVAAVGGCHPPKSGIYGGYGKMSFMTHQSSPGCQKHTIVRLPSSSHPIPCPSRST